MELEGWYCKSIEESIEDCIAEVVLQMRCCKSTMAVTMDQWRGETLAGGATYLIAPL